MTFESNVQSYFDFTICSLNTETPIDKEDTKGVLDNLQQEILER